MDSLPLAQTFSERAGRYENPSRHLLIGRQSDELIAIGKALGTGDQPAYSLTYELTCPVVFALLSAPLVQMRIACSLLAPLANACHQTSFIS